MTYVLSNLDFEYSWMCEKAGGTPPRVVFDVARRWEAILRLVAPGAEVLPLEAAAGRFPAVEAGRRLVVWGWTPAVVQGAREWGLDFSAPPMEAVGIANSKVFSHGLECRNGWRLPGSRLVETVEELQGAVSAIGGPWILKDPWGVSGREQRRGNDSEVSGGVERWARRVFSRGDALVLEPRLKVEEEYSLHFEISVDRGVRSVGACRLKAGREGILRRMGVAHEDEIPPPLAWGAWKVAQATARSGYFGPVGIDAMVGSWKGERFFRPVTEVNARMTFGRLALELWKRLEGGAGHGQITWVHPPRGAEKPDNLEPWPRAWKSGVFALPEEVDPAQRSGTYVELSD